MEGPGIWGLLIVFIVGSNLFTATEAENKDSYKIVCYLGSWANYRTGDGKFVIENIDPFLCTHLIYGFAKLNFDNKIASYDPYLDLKENWGLGAYERFTDLKKKNPNLKTLLAIGGWNEGSTKYSQMAKDANKRKIFIDSCVQFLTKYNFDGLDLDWEYPANRGGIPEDKANFVRLLQELKKVFEGHGLILSAAVGAGVATIDSAYDVPALGKYLDFINVMTYDFHGGWDRIAGHNAPLYARPDESEEERKLNVDYAVKYWLKKGAPAEKLILGMPLYGRSFALQNPQKHGLGSPVTGKGMAGQYTREQGFLGYNELCNILKTESGWNTVVDKYTQAPYTYKERQWIGFDDVKSISIKVDYLKKMKLGGGMVWSIETDDFHGLCHGQRNPLLQAIKAGLNSTYKPTLPDIDSDNSVSPTKEVLFSSSIPDSSTIKLTTNHIWHMTRTTETPKDDQLYCPHSGYFRHPQNCKQFYYCQPRSHVKNFGYQIYTFRCAAGTVFNEELRTCAFPYTVPNCH